MAYAQDHTESTLSVDTNGRLFPFVYKRTFLLTEDDASLTKEETFVAVQGIFVSSTPQLLLVLRADGSVNPVYIAYSGAIVPVVGIGWVATGDDLFGNARVGGTFSAVVGFGGI